MAKFSSVQVGVCEGVSIVARVVHRVAKGVLGAAKDGGVKVLVVARVAHRVAEDVLGAATGA